MGGQGGAGVPCRPTCRHFVIDNTVIDAVMNDTGNVQALAVRIWRASIPVCSQGLGFADYR